MTVLNMGVCHSMREEQLFCSHVGIIGAELKINVPWHRRRLSQFIHFTLPTCPIGVTCYVYRNSIKRPLVAVPAWVASYISEWGKPIQEWKKNKEKPGENLYLISDWNKKGAHTHTLHFSLPAPSLTEIYLWWSGRADAGWHKGHLWAHSLTHNITQRREWL